MGWSALEFRAFFGFNPKTVYLPLTACMYVLYFKNRHFFPGMRVRKCKGVTFIDLGRRLLT